MKLSLPYLSLLFGVCAAQGYFPFRHSTARKFPVKAVGVVRSFSGVTGSGGPLHGVVVFTQTAPTAPVTIAGEISGLTPGLHGFHVHQFGNLSAGCASLGGHFDPEGHTHGGPTYFYRHAGDLGNVEAGSDGVATVYIIDARISLVGKNAILGRGLVIHGAEDDLGKGGDRESLKTGNAGARVGCGIIGLSLELPERPSFGARTLPNAFVSQPLANFPAQSRRPFQQQPAFASPFLRRPSYGNRRYNPWGRILAGRKT